jgi:hypothetical protein
VELLRVAAQQGGTDPAVNLSVLLGPAHAAELEESLRSVSASGEPGVMIELGSLLARKDELPETGECFRRAAEGGSPDAPTRASARLSSRSVRRSAEGGSGDALTRLGAMAVESGDAAAAIAYFQRVAKPDPHARQASANGAGRQDISTRQRGG